MHLIIIEDLKTDRDQLAELIRRECADHKESADISSYASGEEFLECYRPKSCNGIFLDILLGGITGVEVARRVRQAEPRLPIIFTTTERDYAVEAFAVKATDYLVKPLDQGKTARCMERLREYMAVPSYISLLEPSGRGHSMPVDVALDDIIYGQYLDYVMSVCTCSGIYRTRSSFQDFTAQLPHTGRFYVCGRGLVVNLSHVARVLDSELLLKNGEKLSFSRNRRQDIQQAYAQWAVYRVRKGGWA